MSLYDALLKSMPSAAFKLNSAGTGYDDSTGNGKTLAGAIRTNLCPNPKLGVAATGLSGTGGTRVAQGTGWAWQIDGTVSVYPYAGGITGTVGQFISGSIVVSGPAGRTINVQIHDGVGYDTPLTNIVLTGSPQTVNLVSSAATTGTTPILIAYITATGGAWTTGQTLTMTNALFEVVSGVGIPAGPYFDGDNGGIWTGTPNASTSIDVEYGVSNVAAIEMWINPASLAARVWLYDARPTYGYIMYNSGGNLTYTGHSAVYINGVLAASNTIAPTIGEWMHILYIPTAPYNIATIIGQKYTFVEPFLGQIGMIGVYDTAPTSDQALALYDSYMQNPTARAVDSVGFAIAELSNAYTNHSFDWQAISASV